jgi:hypothetical protein
MEIKMKTIQLFLLAGLSLAAGCKKDKTGLNKASVAIPPVVNHQEKKFLPVQIGTNDPKTLFSYTPASSLSKIEYKDGKSTVMNYDQDGRPLALLRYQGSKLISSTEYQLDRNGAVTRGDQFAVTGTKYKNSGYYVLTYNAGGQLTVISYYDTDDNLTGTQQKNYDAAGNLVSEKSSPAGLTISYSYDDRKGIFSNARYVWLFAAEKESGLFLSVINNIRSCDDPENPADHQSFNYIYNSSRYPETISTTIQGKTTNDKVIYKQIE